MADEAAEAKVMVSGMVKGLARQVPVLGTIIDGVDAYLTEERFRAVEETTRRGYGRKRANDSRRRRWPIASSQKLRAVQ